MWPKTKVHKESYKLIHCPLQTLPSISSADLSLSTTDTDFLHTTTSFWVRSTDRLCRSQEHIIRHSIHLTQVHQESTLDLFTSYVQTPTAQAFPSNTQQWVWLCSKIVCCPSTSSYPSAIRTRLPIRRSGKSKT